MDEQQVIEMIQAELVPLHRKVRRLTDVVRYLAHELNRVSDGEQLDENTAKRVDIMLNPEAYAEEAKS